MAYTPQSGDWEGWEFSSRYQYNKIESIYEGLRADSEYPNRAQLFMDGAMNASFVGDIPTSELFAERSEFMRAWRGAERSGFEHEYNGKYAQWLEYIGFRDEYDDSDLYTAE